MKTLLFPFNSTNKMALARCWWGQALLILLLWNAGLPAASGQTKVWDITVGGSNNDALTSLQPTPDGGYILGGSSFSVISGDKSGSNQGDCDAAFCTNDYWVVKLDEAGKKQWDKTIGSSGADFLAVVQPTRDGGFILGGYSGADKSGDKTEASRGSYDYWVVKLDAGGKKEWDKTYGSSSTDMLTSLQQTSDGGYILGGSSPPGKTGDKTGPSRGNYDYWVVKIDAAGHKQWDKTVGGSKTDLLAVVRQTTDGGYILGGFSDSNISGDKTTAKKGGNDYWVVKLDAAGTKEWDKTYGGSKTDILTSLQQTSDGGFILGGYAPSGDDGDISGGNQGGWDYWVVKLNPTGEKQWDKTFGGHDQDLLTDLQQTSDGGYILGGTSISGKNGDKSDDNRGDTDYWVLKLDAAGAKTWDKTYGGENTDGITSLLQASDGSYILGGSSDSDASGDKSQPTQGIADYWVLKIKDGAAAPQALIRFIKPEKEVPGALITIGGQNLTSTTAVRFNGLDAAFRVVNDKTIQATVPVEATSGKITLVTAAGSVTSISTFGVRQPSIKAFAPAQGGPGTIILVTGTRLTTTKEVYFDQVKAGQFEVLSDSTMTATVPEGVETSRIRVVLTGGGKGSSKTKFFVAPALADQKAARKDTPAAAPGLQAAYPNPFSQQVTFRFRLPQAQPVVVQVYDLLGRQVSLLYQGPVQAHQPYQVEWRPSAQQAAGLYFLRLEGAGQVSELKVMLIR
jgi:hypothetical protein